jgi:hypothetical protein
VPPAPPGNVRVIFLSAVGRESGLSVFDRGPGAATVSPRLQALLDLSDPLALEGLTAEDRALIVNWSLIP